MTREEITFRAKTAFDWFSTPNVPDAHRHMPDQVFYDCYFAVKYLSEQEHRMKRLEMREHTRRATSDVCQLLLAEYGIVPDFHAVHRIAQAIDTEMLRFGQVAKGMTPDQWKEATDSPVTATDH